MDSLEPLRRLRMALSRTGDAAEVPVGVEDLRVVCDALEALQGRGRTMPDTYDVFYESDGSAYMVTALALKETGDEIAVRLTRKPEMDDETLGGVKD